MFAQFTDSWVEDKVLFAYLSGGSCQCCGFIAAAPVNDLMSACTDLDTDDKRNHAQDESSWPINVREAVWSNRVEFRQQLKKDSSRYDEFWSTHSSSFVHFYHHLPIAQKLKLFQLHEKEVHQRITRSKFSDAYHLLLLTLLEQIQHFDLTMYPSETDAATPAEKMMVESLRFTRQTFVLHKTYHALEDTIQKADTNTSDNNTAPSSVNKLRYHPAGFLARFVELGSTKILPRLIKREATERKGADDSDDDDDINNNVSEDGDRDEPTTTTSPTSGKQTQSFASDRRLLRILIFRAFADHVMRSFKKSLEEQPTTAAAAAAATGTATAATNTPPSVESITLQLPSLSIEVASPSSDRSQPPLSPSSLDLASPTANGLQLQTAPPPTSQSRPNSAGKRQHIHLVL